MQDPAGPAPQPNSNGDVSASNDSLSDKAVDLGEGIVESLKETWNDLIAHVPGIIGAIIIIGIGFLLADRIAKASKKVVGRKSHDPLMTNFIARLVKSAFIVLMIMIALRIAGLHDVAAGVLTAAGAGAVVIGFAFRDIGENFIAGVILAFKRPFDVNDTVEIGDIFGKVKAMEFRYTKLKTFDGKDVYIPNADVIKEPVFNYTEDGYYRMDFIVGVSYEDNIEEAMKLIDKTIEEQPGLIDDEGHESFITVDELAASTVNLKVYFWVKTIDYRKSALSIKSDTVIAVKRALERENFSMPGEIRELKLYGSERAIPIEMIEGDGKVNKYPDDDD